MKAMLFFALALVLAVPALGQTVSVVQDNVGNNETVYYFHQRNVARATDGTLMVVWINIKSNTAGGQVQYSTYDPAFQTWSPPAAVSSAGDRARQPALAADGNGAIHAVWMQRDASGDKYQEYYAKYSGGGWSTPVQVSVAASVRAEEGTIEVGSDGTVWVAYNNDAEGVGSEYVWVVKSTDGGTTWSAQADTISSGGSIGSSSTNARVTLAPASGGKMVAVWHDGQPWDADRREIYVNTFDGSSWGSEEMISDTTTADRSANWYPTVAVDNQDNIYAVYHTNNITVDRMLLLQKKAWNDPWSASTTSVLAVETTSDMLSTTAVADPNGVVHLAYRRDNAVDTLGLDEIVYTFSDDAGVTWSTPLAVSRTTHDAGYVTLANRVGETYGIDLAWRESRDEGEDDQDTLAVMHANIPYSVVSSVEEPGLPVGYEVLANYPNPFNPSTVIEYSILTKGTVRLEVFDALGRRVKTLVNEQQEPGSYSVRWDGINRSGKAVMSGVYVARMSSASGSRTVKMMLVK
ncbi:MAG: FlgD immunoglobulin-like domain containing protein [Bacteroidota bacterium]